MKTFITLLALAAIIGTCILSCALYLNQNYNGSALLTGTSILAISFLISSYKFVEQKEAKLNK